MRVLKPAEILPVLCDAATDAGTILLKHFRSDVITHSKTSHHDLLTQADTESQEMIVTAIRRGMSMLGVEAESMGFLAEEQDLNTSGTYQFVIDPLDGTGNYASGHDYFSVAIACFVEGVLTAGVVYRPVSAELISAAKGCGATRLLGNEKEVLECRAQDLRDILVVPSINSNESSRERMLRLIKDIYPHVRAVRVHGSTALDVAGVALNSFGAVIQYCFIWDIAASHLILTESGGDVYMWDGTPLRYNFDKPGDKFMFLACHGEMVSKLTPFLKD